MRAAGQEPLVVFVDGGTTHTRAWLLRGEVVVADFREPVGARDTARDGSPARLAAGLERLVTACRGAAAAASAPITRLVAGGMITSPQGLVEVPHVEAPAGLRELAAGAREARLREAGELPCLFLPGVRTGPASCAPRDIGGADMMRGEELLALGLHCRGGLPPGAALLNLGSHWKATRLDEAGRVRRSVTTLTGELVAAVKAETILASALPRDWPPSLDDGFLAQGARLAEAEGLSRALFAVRLLEQRARSTPEERFAFLIGAAIAADSRALVGGAPSVVLVGPPALTAAWAGLLAGPGVPVKVLTPAEQERAFLAGCRAVLDERLAQGA